MRSYQKGNRREVMNELAELTKRYDNLEGAYREEQQWAIKLKVSLANETARLLQAHQAIKLALETCPFPVGAMKAKRELEVALKG